MICLGLPIALVAILVVAAFTSPVQTWVARMVLDRQPGLQSSLGSVSAGFGKVELTDLHLETDDVALTLPSLQARLPLSTAAWDRRMVIRSLMAKGWLIDLSRKPESGEAPTLVTPAPAEAAVVKKVEQIFRVILGGWRAPCDVSLDGVDLEGDVLLTVSPERAPVRVHVIIKGGGMAAGQEGAIAIDATAGDPWPGINSVAAHGRLVVAMSSPRTFNRMEIKADLSAQGALFPEDLAGSVDFAATRSAGEAACTFELSRGRRHLATIQARFSPVTQRVGGEWRVDLRGADLAPFAPEHPLPAIAAVGEGRFDADAAFSRVHVSGHLDAVASHLGVVTPALERVGEMTLATHFDLACTGQSIRVDELGVALAGNRPVAVVRSLQAFDFDVGTGNLKVADPHGDWLEASIQGLPLDWLSGRTGRLTLAGGDATGQFIIRTAAGGFALDPKTPLTAAGVSVQGAGRMLGRSLDLSLLLSAECGPLGWKVQWAPLTVAGAGRRLMTIAGTASRSGGADQPVAITGTWSTDLEALASQPAIRDVNWIAGRSASGEFTASMGTAMELDGKLTVVGHDPAHTLTASGNVDVDASGAVSFQVPVTIAIGKNVSEISAEGNWRSDDSGNRITGRLTGEEVDLEHLRLVAAPLAAAAGFPWSLTSDTGTGGSLAPVADRKPFWTGWSGEVSLAFDHLRSGGRVFHDVGGTLDFDQESIHLERGRGGLPQHSPAQVEGSLSFDAAAGFPYSLKATAALNDIDAAPWFGALPPGRDPMLEGHFSVAATLKGNGRTLDDLVRRTQEEYRVTSTGGIIRLLTTTVGDAISEAPTPVADAVGTVGSWVGWLAGVKKDSVGSSEKPVSKSTDAVLNLTSQIAEIGYDRISITATRGYDRTIHLVAIEMIAPDERLTGFGQITGVKDRPLAAQPLQVEFKLGARGNIAGLMAQAGLLSAQKDELGYKLLVRSFHFGGSLEHLDVSDWRDLLVKAATRKPEGGKDGG